MSEFLSLVTPQDALRKLSASVSWTTTVETLRASDALHRTLADTVRAPGSLPSFVRSTVDGYAVRAANTYGASEGLPVYLRVVGEMPMGRHMPLSVGVGETVRVFTGGAVAQGADAVVMVEDTQVVDPETIEVARPVAPGENVIRPGDDVTEGQELLQKGRVLRPQDIGALMALGITEVRVHGCPRVAIISAGDEVVPPDVTPEPGQVRDINTYTISGLVKEAGAEPLPQGIVKDDARALAEVARRSLNEADMVVISSGSSISTRDMTAGVISSLGTPGIVVHGVSLRPGKPTILAVVGGKPVIGLPGNPVSAMVVFHLFARPMIFKIGGRSRLPMELRLMARLTQNIPSVTGREDYVPVTLEAKDSEYLATPIFGESNLITTMVKAQGIAMVPLEMNGLAQGDVVSVRLFQE